VLTGGARTVTVKGGDTLRTLGSRFGVDPGTIASDNGMALEAVLRMDTVLTIDNRHILPRVAAEPSIVINVPQRMLFAWSEAGLAAYPVAVGRASWQTPLGAFQVSSRETNPTWDVPESIRAEASRAGRSLPLKVPPGPANPLGKYWLGLSVGGVGIHGTNAPGSIYQAVTHGCIRLHPDDIAALFPLVRVGTPGDAVYQPLLLAADGGAVFLEAHRDIYGRGPRDAVGFVRDLARELGLFDWIDWDAAGRIIDQREGVARVVTRR
jgi:L,D-transpeptidase ErfK/SrfK